MDERMKVWRSYWSEAPSLSSLYICLVHFLPFRIQFMLLNETGLWTSYSFLEDLLLLLFTEKKAIKLK